MALIFCERCSNIMVLKKKFSNSGEYACRSCGFSKRMPLLKLEIEEEVKLIPVGTESFLEKKELF